MNLSPAMQNAVIALAKNAIQKAHAEGKGHYSLLWAGVRYNIVESAEISEGWRNVGTVEEAMLCIQKDVKESGSRNDCLLRLLANDVSPCE